MINYIIGVICGIAIGAIGTLLVLQSKLNKTIKLQKEINNTYEETIETLNENIKIRQAHISELEVELIKAMDSYEEGINETISENIALKKKLAIFK